MLWISIDIIAAILQVLPSPHKMLIVLIMQDNILPSLDNSRDNDMVFSLGELSQTLKKTVESVFDQVRVRAEVSRPTRAASGHVYFTLKDDSATLDAVCWKTVAGNLSVQPEEGLEVIVTGKLTTYPGRSKYQIVVKQVELAGEGALLKQLEERKKRLTAEGLFDEGRKKPLPSMPQTIAVVTSPTGAVIRDILHRLEERFPVHVIVWPVLVQGEAASAEVTAAIRGFDQLLDQENPSIPIPDVVIVARGGGSLEDLMAFNEEEVVRAAADCRLPLISAVGHETDTTLIDFAADRRAPTPTAAAELATPVKADLTARLNEIDTRLARNVTNRLEQSSQTLRLLDRGLSDPEMVISAKTQRLDLAFGAIDRKVDGLFNKAAETLQHWAERLPLPSQQLSRATTIVAGFDGRLQDAISNRLTHSQRHLTRSADRLIEPAHQLATAEARLNLLDQRMDDRINRSFADYSSRFDQAARLLEASSFQRVLARGFALVTGPDGQVMRQAEQYQDGDAVTIRLMDGQRQAELGAAKGGGKPPAPKKPQKAKKPSGHDDQGDLF